MVPHVESKFLLRDLYLYSLEDAAVAMSTANAVKFTKKNVAKNNNFSAKHT